MKSLLNEGEEVITTIRKHWFFIALQAAISVVLATVPFVFFIIFGLSQVGVTAKFVLLCLFCYSVWMLFLWIGFFIFLTTYYLDCWHITTDRIIDVEQVSLFGREVTSLPYRKIQDVTIETHGVLATFLRFGKIQIETAGSERKVILARATDPEATKKLINRLLEQDQAKRNTR